PRLCVRCRHYRQPARPAKSWGDCRMARLCLHPRSAGAGWTEAKLWHCLDPCHNPFEPLATPCPLATLSCLDDVRGRETPMYAVFENGSHQYRVSEGELVRVDYRD